MASYLSHHKPRSARLALAQCLVHDSRNRRGTHKIVVIQKPWNSRFFIQNINLKLISH